MATSKFQSPFPPMELGYDDKKELCRISKRVVGETVEAFERFVFQDAGQVNPSRWCVLKASDDVRVYHERRAKSGATEGRDFESLLTVGTVVGSLDDAMFGVLSHTTDAMRLKAAYMQELGSLANGAVLATVQEPKTDKPFRSMTVKWVVKTLPMPARAVTKPRDLVLVEHSGTMRLSTGERVGFHLAHSVDHLHQARALPTFVRANTSVCAIWRQPQADRLQVYVRSFVETPERLLASVTLRVASESLVAVWRHMHCAQMKKLAWLLRRQLPDLSETKKPTTGPAAGRCTVCTAKGKNACVVCARTVCSTCSVKRELWTIEAGGGDMAEQRVCFCVPCLSIAIRTEAAEVARDELQARRDHADVVKDPSSTRSRKTPTPTRPVRSSRESGSSSTSSELTQDTYSRTSSKPHFTMSMSSQ